MSNYYEILELESSATQAEIKTAIDEKYAYWNSLASHHDPEMVEKASHEKRQLEEIRAVLGSKAKRKKYDAGSEENIGGLAEQTRSKNAAVSKPTTSEPITQSRSSERLDAWICPKCRQVNTIGQKFCCKCGGQIGEECPQCKHLSQIANAFCPRCGTNKAQVSTERKQEDALARIKVLQDSIASKRDDIEEIQYLSRKIPFIGYDKANEYMHKKLWGGSRGCSTVPLMKIALLIVIFIIEGYVWVNIINSVFGESIDSWMKSTTWAGPLLACFTPLIVVFPVFLLVSYLGDMFYRPVVVKKANEII